MNTMEMKPLKNDATKIYEAAGPIKWTNKYDCPEGYGYNDEGWVLTEEAHPKISVSMFPHLLNVYEVSELLYFNLLAIHALNPYKPFSVLLSALINRMRASFLYYVKEIPTDVIERAKERYINFEGYIPDFLPRELCRKDTIWYSEDCETKNLHTIRYFIKEDAIDRTRDTMTIHTKYKTNDVSDVSGFSHHIVRKYWKSRKMTRIARSLSAISEAYLYLKERGIDMPSQKELSDAAGVSVRTIRDLQPDMTKLLPTNEEEEQV